MDILFVNYLQVESPTINDTVKVPIAVLKAGENRSVQTCLEFPDAPVTFKLVEGNGPVYIHGQQSPGNYEIEGTNMMSEEEEDGVSIPPPPTRHKRALINANQNEWTIN